MKKSNLISLCILGLTGLTYSCSTQRSIPIVLDGTNLDATVTAAQIANKHIANGSIVNLSLTNLNKDLYTVKITPNNVSYNTTVPAGLGITSASLPSPIFPSSFTGASLAANCKADVNKEQANINKYVPLLQANIDNINKAIAFNNFLLLTEKDCGKTAAAIKADIDNQMNAICGSRDVSIFKKFINSEIAAAKLNYSFIAKSIIKVDRIYANPDCKVPLTGTTGFTDSEKAQLSDFKTFYGKLLDFDQTQQIEVVVQNYRAVTEPLNYTFSAIDTAKRTDEVNFAISIIPKNWTPCAPVNKTYNIKMKVNRFKIDFSTGIFLNWGDQKFTGKKYFIDTNKKVASITNGNKSVIPSIGALIHLYYHYGGVFEPGLVFGTSISSDVNFTNFHAGLSFMFNTDNEVLNRIAISGGFTYRYVKDLNSSYQVGTAVDKNLTIDQVENGKFIKGYFVALTYNLTKK